VWRSIRVNVVNDEIIASLPGTSCSDYWAPASAGGPRELPGLTRRSPGADMHRGSVHRGRFQIEGNLPLADEAITPPPLLLVQRCHLVNEKRAGRSRRSCA
jgi:hypothetical protein